MEVDGFVRGGDICTGEGHGTHRFDVSGVIGIAGDGTPTLHLVIAGTWYDTWDGEIVCTGGIPPSGPWSRPSEPNTESLTLAPFGHEAAWEKDVAMGMCRGAVSRVLDFDPAAGAPGHGADG